MSQVYQCHPDQWPAANLVTIVDDGGASMATGVDQIRFSFHATNGDYNWSVYKEIDVFGWAMIQPPNQGRWYCCSQV